MKTNISTTFEVHTADSAPAGSRAALESAQQSLGSIPNLFGVFAESPATLRAYAAVGSILEASSMFTATELQVVLLTASFVNDCEYCVAAHTAIAGASKVSKEVIKSLRDGSEIADARLEALRLFTKAVVERRGWVEGNEVRSFLDAGFTKGHVLEVILGVAFKTLSNFTNHIAATPVDAQFQRFAWSKPEGCRTNR